MDPPDDSSLEIEPLLGEPGETIKQVSLYPERASSQTKQLVHLIEESKEILSENSGCNTLVEHTITLNTTKPVRFKPYPIPFAKVSDVVTEVDKMLNLEAIEPSKSPYCSPLLFVQKTGGTNRAVVGFRQLTPATISTLSLWPILMHCLSLCLKTMSSKLNCSKGYWQIAMHAKDIEKTAFSSPPGLFQFRRMPFGLVHAGTSYGRMKRILLNGLSGVDNTVDDDIVVHTHT